MAKSQASWSRVLLPPLITALVTLGVAVYAAHRHPSQLEVLFPNPTPTTTVTATTTTTVTVEPTSQTTDPPTEPSTTPVAGSSLIYLADLEPVVVTYVRGDRPRTVEKKPYAKALSEVLACRRQLPTEWVLPDGVDRFQASVGLDDTSPTADARVQFTVAVDGKAVIQPITVGLKQTRAIDVSVRGGLRLRLNATPVAGSRCSGTIAVWGDAAVTTR